MLEGNRGRTHGLRTLGAYMVAVLLNASCQTVGSVPAAAPGPRRAEDSGARPRAARPSTSARPAVPANRGLWVVRTTLVHPDSVRAMVNRAADAGFNTLLVQVRARGDSYFSGGMEPRADALDGQPDFDPLALTLEEAHRRGLEVHAWINVHLVANASRLPADRDHMVHARPDLLAVPRELAAELYWMDPAESGYVERLRRHADENRNRIEGLYSSPSSPDVKEHVYSVAMDLVDRYDIDGIHLDYVRYPSDDYDYSRSAVARFRTWVSERVSPNRRAALDEAEASDPFAYTEALPGPWAEFRRAHITDLVERIHTGARRRRPDVVLSAAVFPDAQDSFEHRHQDWAGWLREGIIDVVAPMAYTADDARYEELIDHAVRVGGASRVWAGVGSHVATYQGTLDMIGIARAMGVRGVMLFSYDWAVASGEGSGGRTFLSRVGEASFGR